MIQNLRVVIKENSCIVRTIHTEHVYSGILGIINIKADDSNSGINQLIKNYTVTESSKSSSQIVTQHI